MAHPVSNEGYYRTFVFQPTHTPEFCQEYFQDFRQDTEGVGVLLLGDSEASQRASKIIDPVIFLPGGRIPVGRCVWIKDPDCLKEAIEEAYSGQITTPLEECVCLFLSKDKTRLVEVIEQSTPIDEIKHFLIIKKFMKANKAKTIS